MKIAEGLPEADEQGQQDSQRLKRALDVVAKEFRVAENQTSPRIVVGVPGGERREGKQERNRKSPEIWRARSPFASIPEHAGEISSHANRARGARMAVSFAKAASENQKAVCQFLPLT